MKQEWILALLGGALIGLAASVMLLFNGRVMGISGILNRALSRKEGPNAWRWSALAGLLAGGIALSFFYPEAFAGGLERSDLRTVLAGFLVGLGAVIGNGCTSGHGVCGISRLSPPSLAATVTFIAAGALTVAALRAWGAL